MSSIINGVRLTRSENWGEYQADCTRRLAMFEGDFREQVREYVALKMSQAAWTILGPRMDWTEIHNVLWSVIKRTTLIYTGPVSRTSIIERVEGQEPVEDPAYAEALETIPDGLDYWMRQASHRAQVCGLVLLRPYVSPDRTNQLRIQLFTPDAFTPIMDPHDPRRQVGGTFFITNPDNVGGPTVTREWVWDAHGLAFSQRFGGPVEPGVAEMDQNGRTLTFRRGNDYPYWDADGRAVFPFATCVWRQPHDRLYNRSVGQDLFDATIMVNKLKAQIWWILWNQSHKQIVITGVNASMVGEQVMDPTMPFFLQGDEKEVGVTLLDLKTDPATVEAQIDKILESVLTDRGWSLDEFTVSAQRQTAEAQTIQQQGKQQWHNEQVQSLALPTEEQMFDLIRLVWNTDARGVAPINEKGKLAIDFPDPFEPSPYTNIDAMLGLVDRNILNTIDIMRQVDPDVETTEQGMDRLALNKKINRQAKSWSGSTAAVAELVAATNPAQGQTPVTTPQEERETAAELIGGGV